jgi:hypothetical protein
MKAVWSAWQAWRLEARARRIRDPIEKLRYLRRQQGLLELGRRRRNGMLWVWAASAALLAPVPTASDAVLIPVVPQPERQAPEVWLVEEKDGVELYSNGLRVENSLSAASERRSYPVYDPETLRPSGWRSEPAGIVYHTTESHIAPFTAEHNLRLRRVGRFLLDYVRANRSYHFVIDRFGRVHRLVRETDVAYHAGSSIWADDRCLYLNLNTSFLGVAFETETPDPARGATLTPPQLHAGRVLTEMLRSRHRIAAANCVTHAQVSVAPAAMWAGNHLDWSANFPFEALGLANNYNIPLPAVAIFGFRFDRDFQKATAGALGRGLALGEEIFRRRASAHRMALAEFRAAAQRRYRELIKARAQTARAGENTT